MNGLPLVVADTTPLNYLVLIGRADVLVRLFDEVWIPEAVVNELRHPKVPPAVSQWLQSPPAWLRRAQVQCVDPSIALGAGENEAISLALERQVRVVLMDERRGRAAAQARGLLTVGTLNLIDLGDELGFLDGIEALQDLRQTTFRAEKTLLDYFEAKLKSRPR